MDCMGERTSSGRKGGPDQLQGVGKTEKKRGTERGKIGKDVIPSVPTSIDDSTHHSFAQVSAVKL